MFKKIAVGGLIAILVGALALGAYDLIQGDSVQAYRGASGSTGVGEAAGNGQGNGKGNGSSEVGSRGSRIGGQAENSGSGQPEPQATVDEWITVSGVVESIDTTGLTLETADGTLVVELGPEQFWTGQDVTVEPGDAVEVLGFYEGEAFVAGDILLTATGEQIMLRDPDGRPLWAGGTSSTEQRQGRGGNDQEAAGETGARGDQSLADGSQVPQPQAMVGEWITVQGTVTAVELNALTIETVEGESMLVQLGPEHFWTTQGVVFEAGDDVTITGFFEDEVNFSAGSVTVLESGETLLLRDTDGRPLWAGGPGRGGNGNR